MTIHEDKTPFVMKRILLFGLSFLIVLGTMAGCEGPSGPEGPQGPEGAQGPEGPVGPAGEDGSMIYSGQGAPTSDIGSEGDYYLNNDTGELYGPKDSNGWGQPIIVLKGEAGSTILAGSGAPTSSDGKVGDFYLDKSTGDFYGPKTQNGWGTPTNLKGADGEDGSVIHAGSGAPSSSLGKIGDFYLDKSTGDFYGPKTENGWGTPTNLKGDDGQDGEDGSQIYSGTGAPSASLGVEGDYYLDKSNYDLYGPKTSNGWGTPLNLKGADGNANVTRYIYSSWDFSSNSVRTLFINNMSESEFNNSAFLVYLFIAPNGSGSQGYYQVPGYGQYGATYYRLNFYHLNGDAKFWVQKRSGDPGEQYDRIEIVHIKASNVVDNRKSAPGSPIIPEGLDTSDYSEVAEYFGFGNIQ